MLVVWSYFGNLFPSGKQSIEFSVPHFNYVTIIDFAQMANRQHIYYGDEIDLAFWEFLGLKIGETWVPENPRTLISGWRYDYYATSHRFEVYNNYGILVSVISNIESIADMNIDFTIHKSHQFRVIYQSGGHERRIPTPADRVIVPMQPFMGLTKNHVGVNNEYTPDRIRPYGSGDSDNPSHWYWWMMEYEEEEEEEGEEEAYTCPEIKDIFKLIYFMCISSINYGDSLPNNKFYSGYYEYEYGSIEEKIYHAHIHVYKYLLPIMGVNMYPYLLPVQKQDELMNNRPLYEPWLIWGFYLLAAHRRLDDDDLGLDIFDLSPRYT